MSISKKIFKNDNGGLLLEILLMLGIMMVLFPFMQKDIKKRTDNLRNQMVIRDLLKLKSAVEDYLKTNLNFKHEGIIEVPVSDLQNVGLSKGFKMINVLKQKYSVKIRFKRDTDGNLVYDALIIATGGDVSSLRIRDIVKESKGFTGYTEGDFAYGSSWQFSIKNWGINGVKIPPNSLVVRPGLFKKDYEYISRKADFGSATMKTDLYMNLHNINRVRKLEVRNELKTLEASLNSNNGLTIVENLSVSSMFKLFSGAIISISSILNFPNGADFKDLIYEDENLKDVFLKNTMKLKNLKITKNDYTNKIMDIDIGKLEKNHFPEVNIEFRGDVNFKNDKNDKNDIKIDDMDVNTTNIKGFGSPKNNGIDIFSNNSKFGYISGTLKGRSFDNHTIDTLTFKGKDIILRKLNNEIIKTYGGKLGGIDIKPTTPLSVILRGIHYSYCDLSKLAGVGSTIYGTRLFNSWTCKDSNRCEFESCDSHKWHN